METNPYKEIQHHDVQERVRARMITGIWGTGCKCHCFECTNVRYSKKKIKGRYPQIPNTRH